MTTSAVVAAATTGLSTVDLTTLAEVADLQTRVDRKYIADPRLVAELLIQHSGLLAVLEIDDAAAFSYESVYFDTPELESYAGSAFRRRRRFKVRTRSYLDSGLSLLEVKTLGGRGETIKERIPHALADRSLLDDDDRAFLRSRQVPASAVDQLRPVLTTRYHRTTLLSQDGSRATLDVDLWCGNGSRTTGLPHHVLVETKSTGAPTDLDRGLWRAGVRPLAVSKFGTGLAAVTPGLPANKWNRTLRTYFDWQPQRSQQSHSLRTASA